MKSAFVRGQFSPHLQAIFLNLTENLEKKEKNPLKKIQRSPVEMAPRNCRFLSLVVVKRILIFAQHFNFFFQLGCAGV